MYVVGLAQANVSIPDFIDRKTQAPAIEDDEEYRVYAAVLFPNKPEIPDAIKHDPLRRVHLLRGQPLSVPRTLRQGHRQVPRPPVGRRLDDVAGPRDPPDGGRARVPLLLAEGVRLICSLGLPRMARMPEGVESGFLDGSSFRIRDYGRGTEMIRVVVADAKAWIRQGEFGGCIGAHKERGARGDQIRQSRLSR